jgi:hypothetical protein
MLLINLEQIIDSLDAETLLVSVKIMVGEPAESTPVTVP